LRSPPLFWRTFLLILMLIVASMTAWLPTVRVLDREPRARQIAQQVVSIVNTTRSALIFSDPSRRRELLADLAENEGIRVVPLEPADQVQPLPDQAIVALITRNVRAKLGPATRLAAQVNGVPGVWVSFTIDEDAYWAFIDRDILAGDAGRAWISWAALATLLSTLIAAAVARVVNRPLAALSKSAAILGAGGQPSPLPDDGPAEIRTVNRNFNRMVADLDRLERDRSILLAGISHDLRTPLTRLRLELELNALSDPIREAMTGDLDQMESIVRQFLDYARPMTAAPTDPVDLSALAREAVARSRVASDPRCRLSLHIEPGVHVLGHSTELARALDNLISNALRYGRGSDGLLQLSVLGRREGDEAVLEVGDRGPGIAPDEVDRLLRPFERGEAARTGAAGAGLGLAIVDRIARIHRGRLQLGPAPGGGLIAQLRLPGWGTAASAAQSRAQ